MRSVPLAALLVLVVLTPSALAAWGMPEPITEQLEIIQDLYNQILLVGVIVFLIVFIWMAVTLYKFRPGGDGKHTFEEDRADLRAELVWTLIPILIVGWVGVVSFQGLSELNQPPEDPAVEIEVTGLQWFWEFDYGNDVVLSQKPAANGSLAGQEPFYIPANEPVLFNITSGDVIHSFWLTELGAKVDANPNERTVTWVTAPEGTYMLQCAEFCGLNHAYMNAQIKAVPMDEYQAWLEEKRAEVPGQGQQLSVNVTDDAIEPASLQAVAGSPLSLTVNNQASEERELSIEGTGNATGPIAPGETGIVNATLEAGNYTLASGDLTATLEIVEAERVTVELDDPQGGDEWAVRMSKSTLEPGQTYVLEVTNVGGTVHNVFLGTPEESGGSEDVLWSTRDLKAGESTTLIVTPSADQAGEYEAWCDVPGHYQLGMTSGLTISG